MKDECKETSILQFTFSRCRGAVPEVKGTWSASASPAPILPDFELPYFI